MNGLARNTLNLAINRFCPPIFGFLLIVVVAGSSSELLGWYTIVTVYFLVFQTLPFLGLTPHIVKEAVLRPADVGRIYGTVLALAMVAVGLIALGLSGVLAVVDLPEVVRPAIWISLFTAIPYAAAYSAELIYVAAQRTTLLGIVPVLENAARVVLSIAALRPGYGLDALFWITFAGRLFAAVTYVAFLPRLLPEWHGARVDRRVLADFLRQSPVFALNTLMVVLIGRLGFLVLAVHVDAESIGHYSVGYRWLDLSLIVLTALAGAAFPRLAQSRARADFSSQAVHLLKVSTVVALMLGAAGFGAADHFVALLFPGQYPDAVALMRVLVLGIPLGALRIVTQTVFFSASRPVLDLLALSFGCVIYGSLLVWWVPLFGVAGAAWALLAQTAAEAALRVCLAHWLVTRGDAFVVVAATEGVSRP